MQIFFLLCPFLLSVTILFTPILNIFPLNPTKFNDAVLYCNTISNEDVYFSEYGTMQDACIVNFMGEYDYLKNLVILFSVFGLFFIFPLFLYLIRNLKAYIKS